MENMIVERYMKLIEPLGYEIKLELISKVIDSLRGMMHEPKHEPDKAKILYELYGAWAEIDDEMVEEIFEGRTIDYPYPSSCS